MNTIYGELLRPFAILYVALSVSVDLMNPTEVERLRQVLGLWTRKILELEIIFKVCTYIRSSKLKTMTTES